MCLAVLYKHRFDDKEYFGAFPNHFEIPSM